MILIFFKFVVKHAWKWLKKNVYESEKVRLLVEVYP